ncbi:MAG TPA: ATP-dependent DNA ligase [Candidatus Saccharimonadales bacterium]|nr:ATP-dependent DNA ligase [Candidatus Saccharimonadales bacterium]
MQFTKLAEFFEKLESETKRNVLIQIMSDVFKEATPAEVDKICYLLQGRVVPFFDPTEIGMAEKMVEQAVAAAYKVPRESVAALSGKEGDMGQAAAQLNQKAKIKATNITVSEVHEKLLKIAQTTGVGSVEKKISQLAELLSKVNPAGAKHLVRVPLGLTRLGIGDPTVLDALSLAKTGEKTDRKALEEAYNKTSDLGYVAKIYWDKGLKAVNQVELLVGKPMRPALAERLPDAEAVVKRMGDKFAVEPKFDGFRCQVHKEGKSIRIFSRNLEDFTSSFPDLVKGSLEEIEAKSVILEGEAIAFNPASGEFLPFQETTKRRRKYGVEEAAEKMPLKLFCFDLLYLNGKDITKEPYSVRREKLKEIIRDDSVTVREAQGKIAHTAKDLTEQFEEAITEGLEGVMIKKLDSPYQAGARNFNWIKFKRMVGGELSDTVDCVLLGYLYGTGKRTSFGVGGLLVGVYNPKEDRFESISRIGTGLTDEEWRKVKEMADKNKLDHKPARVESLITPSVWVEPEIVLEIFADEITRSPLHSAGKTESEPGYALRFPRLVSFRGDSKRAEDATTVEEIEKMYKAQFKHLK